MAATVVAVAAAVVAATAGKFIAEGNRLWLGHQNQKNKTLSRQLGGVFCCASRWPARLDPWRRAGMLLSMNVIACQLDIAWHDLAKNRERVAQMLQAQSVEPGSLIVLPEMFQSGFTMDVSAAVGEPEETQAFLSDLAARYASTVVAGVVALSDNGKGLNQAVTFGPGGEEICRYTKLQPFTPAGESDHYLPGESVATFEYAGLVVSPFVCYDLRFPEWFRVAADRSVEVLVVIASWPATRAEHWSALLNARAIENQAFVVGVNRVGKDPNATYPGLSTVIDPTGRVLAVADDREQLLRASIERDVLAGYRQAFPFLEDKRP